MRAPLECPSLQQNRIRGCVRTLSYPRYATPCKILFTLSCHHTLHLSLSNTATHSTQAQLLVPPHCSACVWKSHYGLPQSTTAVHHTAQLLSGAMCLQVCRRWKQVLTNPATSNILWREVIIDFGHELITAVHTPIAWSDRRPSDEEFRESFSHTRLSAARMVHFVEERQSSIRRLVLMNSEGYWSGAPSCCRESLSHI